MPSFNRNWLTYWEKTLKYSEIKPIEIINEPIIQESFYCIKKIETGLAQKLWKQARASKDNEVIAIALCPAQSEIVVTDQFTEKSSVQLFWIIVLMNAQGELSLPKDNANPKPFFVRDYLHPNPDSYITLGSINEVDKALESFKFDSNNIHEHWQQCEELFTKVTGKSFIEFNTFEKCHIYIEVAPIRGIAENIFNLYSHLLKSDSPADNLLLLSNLIDDKQKSYSPYPHASKVFENTFHIGQFSGDFPLSHSQRVSMRGFTDGEKGDIIAVNGPPGTGKTTLLQSIVANLTVQYVLDNKPPPLIMASSTNNQAITNILNGFSLPNNKELLTSRWLPEVPSLGLYMSSKNLNNYLMYDLKEYGQTTGFFTEYENKSHQELTSYFINKMNKYFYSVKSDSKISSIKDAKNALKNELEKTIQKINNSFIIFNQLTENNENLADFKVTNRTELESNIFKLNNEVTRLEKESERWELTKEKLYKSYDSLPFFTKLFRFLPIFKKRRASLFELIYLKTSDSKPDNIDWSNHHQIIEILNQKLINNQQNINTSKSKLNSFQSFLVKMDKSEQKWQRFIQEWNDNYLVKLNELYKLTGNEYQQLDPLEDLNIRLDISYRHEAFWLAMHYREADYLIQLSQIKDKKSAEFGHTTYIKKLQRYACLTPIFISTFHSLPKNSKYFNQEELPYYELYDYLIVDEAGQVSPEVAVPSFSLAKTALIVGDSKQIEPIRSVNKPIDIINCTNYVLNQTKFNSINDPTIFKYDKQGKLASSGSLMMMAQQANKYYSGTALNSISTNNDKIIGFLLTEHRRCLDQLISYSNKYVYHGLLQPKRGVKPSVELDFIKGNKGYIHIDFYSETQGKSKVNILEAKAIAQWINKYANILITKYQKSIHEIVAVVTPYKSQTIEIKNALRSLKQDKYLPITVGTVHTLQGAERPIILFSLVASPQDNLSFLNSQYNLLNVTISRAKDYFVFFGNINTLSMTHHTPLGNLKVWLLDNRYSELDNTFIYDYIGREKPREIYKDLVQVHINSLAQHERHLIEACKKTINELVIVSPFLSINAISNELEHEMKQAVLRGIKVIVYCDARLDNDNNNHRKNHSQKAVYLLGKIGADIRVIEGIHSKTMIFETAKGHVLIEGSFNWLSAVRDMNNSYSRYEASIVLMGSKLKDRIEQLKSMLKNRSQRLQIN